MEEFTEDYKQMRSVYKTLCRTADGGIEQFAEANTILKAINEDFSFLEELAGTAVSQNNSSIHNVTPQGAAGLNLNVDPDVAVNKLIKQLVTKFDTLD